MSIPRARRSRRHAGDLGPSLTSVRAQGEPHPALAVLGPPLPEGVDAETFGPGNESGLRSFFRSAAMVAFLSPGQAAAPLAAQALRGAPAGDVLYWRAAGGAGLGPDPDLAVALGARTSGLAIRGDVLAALPPDFAASLAREGLGALEAWAAGAGLKWTELDEPIATPAARAGARSTRGAGERPRRLSLCAWSGWDEGPPLALRALLAGADGFDVEILAPADRAKGLQDQIAAWASPGARSLAVRPVDVPGAGGSAPLWRIMTLAATGQVAILCHGEAEVPPEALANLAAWAHRQDIGAATLPLRADTEGGLAGLTLELAGGFCTAAEAGVNGADLTGRPILAAPAAFMAISRAALAVADGFDADGAGELADLDLGLRLRGLGRRSVLLTGFQAEAPAELIRRWRRRVVSPSLISALSAGARADVAAFASLTAAPR
ncbi:MAG: hypothetical protein B7Y99_03175 [Caulobacterales bacterium 32-69-10]|nr:MAG: hypothetical protein B7Y99_03175 [Caulobacterales bacterium 32-69-10]